jgi:hypothetical protein
MREFTSLKPKGLPKAFDAKIQGEEPIVDIREEKGKIEISYVFPGFYLSDDTREVGGKKIPFKHCNIPKIGFLSESGKPLLPSFGRYVQIPFNCTFAFSVKKDKPVEFDNILILTAQEILTDEPVKRHAFEYDTKFYAKDELYPKEIVNISGPFEVDGYNSLLVHVRPFQYNPAKKKLFGYSNITVTIDIKPEKGKPGTDLTADRSESREAFGNLFLNPRRSVEDRLGLDRGKTVTISGTISPGVLEPVPLAPHVEIAIGIIAEQLRKPEFLIIYHKKFEDAAIKLAKWKIKKGIVTEIVPLDKVGTTVNKIKSYIRGKRGSLNSRLRYVLLFGDVDMIPSELIGSVITDYYYSTDTDPSGNNYVLPWLSIGRIPVRSESEGLSVVDEIINYERNPPTDPDYYRIMTFAAFFQDDNMDGRDDRCYMKTMEDVRNVMVSLGFTIERVYVTENPTMTEFCDGTSVPADVKSSIVNPATATTMLINATSEGRMIIGHRDHGDWNGWYMPPFQNGHLSSVIGTVPTIFYSINCLTGKFDETAPTECFGEMLLRMNGAAPSLIAATRVSGTWRNHSLIKALFDASWGGVIATFPGSTASYPLKNNRLGDILNYAKSYLPVKHSGENAGIKDHFEIYHVIGDPTLEVYRSQPMILSITAIRMLKAITIKLPGVPLGSVLTLWYKDKLVKRIEPKSETLSISLKEVIPSGEPGERDSITICFSAPGHQFIEKEVRV